MLTKDVNVMDMPAEAEVNKVGTEVKAVLKAAPASRIYFLDNLKAFLVILVVVHHAAQPYGPGGGWWIASEPYNIIDFIVLGLFMAVNASFFMGLFFMISAYFVPSSLERKGAGRFMRDRLVKLGVPMLVFFFGVFPVMGYLLNGEPAFTLWHLWFLEILLLFSAAYAAYWLVKKPSSKVRRAFPGNTAIVAFTVAMALISFVVRIWAPENYWLPFLFEPFHITEYVMLFIAGIVAYREGWIDTIPKATAKLWSRAAVIVVVLLPVISIMTGDMEFAGGFTVASLLGSFWEAFMCVSLCIALLALFKNKYDSHGPLARALADNSFTVYLIHIPVVVFLQYLLIGVAMESLVKFAIVGALGVLLSFAISHYVIRRLPYAKYILG
jgi:glucan biosynthesis protein C